MRPSARHILEYLVGCFRGELIKSLHLVWPSNEFLMEQTGLSERAVRYALKELVQLSVIAPRDSANGKRFAIRSAKGQIVDAFGFDLGPLIQRREEIEARARHIKQERQERKRQLDEVTICRRHVLAVANALQTPALLAEIERLERLTPRRDTKMPVTAALAMWRSLKEEADRLHITAFGGKNSRHIEDNNDSPDQSCSNGKGEYEGGGAAISITDVVDACPDAIAYADDGYSNLVELSATAGRLRGGLGVHESAWSEALGSLGLQAGVAFFVTLQHYDRDQARKAQIKNFGGYFRAFVRKVAAGQLDLKQEIAALKYRRRN